MKAGVKTSEFWVAILGAILPVLNSQLGLHIPTDQVMTILGLLASYVVSRSVVKARIQ